MNPMELFAATQKAYDDAQAAGKARDAAAVACQNELDAAEDAHLKAIERANAALAVKQQAYEAAAEKLKGLQAQLGELFGKVLPTGDPRIRQSR